MADIYIGEIRAFALPYAPEGWALCDGSSLPVLQNQALYSLLGNRFGGNSTNFNIPDLRGRTMVSFGQGTTGTVYQIGNTGGIEAEILTINQTPAHNHNFQLGNVQGIGPFISGTLAIPHGGTATVNPYNTNATTVTTLMGDSITDTGGGAGHENMQPFTTLNFCIAVTGLYPSRN